MASEFTPPVREKLFPGEKDFFRRNPHVTGMAADDNKVILNPFVEMAVSQRKAVIVNESARIIMRSGRRPTFALTPKQKARFATYSRDVQDIRETIAARILSGDASAGETTKEQLEFVETLRQRMFGK